MTSLTLYCAYAVKNYQLAISVCIIFITLVDVIRLINTCIHFMHTLNNNTIEWLSICYESDL